MTLSRLAPDCKDLPLWKVISDDHLNVRYLVDFGTAWCIVNPHCSSILRFSPDRLERDIAQISVKLVAKPTLEQSDIRSVLRLVRENHWKTDSICPILVSKEIDAVFNAIEMVLSSFVVPARYSFSPGSSCAADLRSRFLCYNEDDEDEDLYRAMRDYVPGRDL